MESSRRKLSETIFTSSYVRDLDLKIKSLLAFDMRYSWDGNVKRSSATNPFPVVIPSERRNVDSKIKILKSDRQSLINMSSSATSEKIHAFYTSLMDAMFLFVGADGGKYPKCFEACIDVCKATDMHKATNWYSWEGFRSFMRIVGKVEALTRRSNLVHCPAAPELMVVIALEQAVLHGKIGGRSKISDFIRDFECYSKAVSVICYFENGNRQDTLTLNQPWDLIPKVQHPPSRLIDQSKLSTSPSSFYDRASVSRNSASRDAIKAHEEPPLIQLEPSPADKVKPPAERQTTPHIIQNVGLHDTFKLVPLVTNPMTPYDAHRAEPNPLHQAAPYAVLQAGQPAMNQYMSPSEHQNTPVYTCQATSFRERGREGLMTMPMPRQESAIIRETHMQVSRAEMTERLQPLFDRLNHENWTGSIEDDFMRVLTEKSIKVVSAEAKGMLRLWASRIRNEVVLSWLEQAQEDVTVFQWIERYAESPSAMWCSGQSVRAIIHDLDQMIGAVSEPTLRDQLWAKVSALRGIIASNS